MKKDKKVVKKTDKIKKEDFLELLKKAVTSKSK